MTTRPDPYPWLDHLRRDRRGLPVPYINAWGAEGTDWVRVEHDPNVGGDAIFHVDHGDVPDFTRQAQQRQRQCVIEGLCQVCGKPVPWSRRNLVLGAGSVEWQYIAAERREVPMVDEPWLCDRCCAIAVSWCPALIRRKRDEKLQVVKVQSKRDASVIVSQGWVDGERYAWTRRKSVFMWAKIQLLNVQILRAPAAAADQRGA